MTLRTGDPTRQKRRACIPVSRLGQRWLRLGAMAPKASRIYRQHQWHLTRSQIIGRHIPDSLLAVPVDRNLEPIPILLKEIGPTPQPGTYEVPELSPPFESVARLTFVRISHKSQVDPSALLNDSVGNSRSLVGKFPRQKTVRCQSTGIGHWGLTIALVNCFVTGRAGRIRVTLPDFRGLCMGRRTPRGHNRHPPIDQQTTSRSPKGPKPANYQPVPEANQTIAPAAFAVVLTEETYNSPCKLTCLITIRSATPYPIDSFWEWPIAHLLPEKCSPGRMNTVSFSLNLLILRSGEAIGL